MQNFLDWFSFIIKWWAAGSLVASAIWAFHFDFAAAFFCCAMAVLAYMFARLCDFGSYLLEIADAVDKGIDQRK